MMDEYINIGKPINSDELISFVDSRVDERMHERGIYTQNTFISEPRYYTDIHTLLSRIEELEHKSDILERKFKIISNAFPWLVDFDEKK